MQISNVIIILVAKLCALLIVGAMLFTVYVHKLKAFIRQQQENYLSWRINKAPKYQSHEQL
jgi:hypothetical protein